MACNMTSKLYDLRKSFVYAFRGVVFCIRYERNMRIHVTATVYVFFFALTFYELNRAELILLILTCSVVMSLEALNTALEVLTDKASPEYSSLAKAAKDAAAGAVLLSSIAAAIIGVLLFWDLEMFRVIADYFIQSPLLLVALLISAILAGIFVLNGKERRKRGKRK